MVAKTQSYRQDLRDRYWRHQRSLPSGQGVLDSRYNPPNSPPVFTRDHAHLNVLSAPNESPAVREALIGLVPGRSRHRWFRSMNSSQALAQSVFGNLKLSGRVPLVTDLDDDSGLPLFGSADLTCESVLLEHDITHLGEPRPTSVDVLIQGDYQVAVECKFTESKVGPCSRPAIGKNATNYESGHCDGTYTIQRGRQKRCSLSQIGVQYWDYVPLLFTWDSGRDLSPCPLRATYQLVRNVLAACVRPDGRLCPGTGHAVLVYDARNPAFQVGGDGFEAFRSARDALRDPSRLRKCSWQRLVGHLRQEGGLPWLTEQLHEKYGF